MTTNEFKDCLVSYYQTEVLGEAFFAAVLIKFSDPIHRYKIASLLQHETETKARLRPVILELGGSVAEEELSRQTGREMAAPIANDNWQEFVSFLRDLGEPLLQRQRKSATSAPAAYHQIADEMRVHGESIQNFAECEVAGDGAHSIDEVVAQLKFPLLPLR